MGGASVQLGRRGAMATLFAGTMAAASAPAFGGKSAPLATGARLHRARRGDAEVTIFGFGEGRDYSWLSPALLRAFDAASELWLEVAGPDDQPKADAAAVARMDALSHEDGRTLYQALDGKVAEKLKRRLAQLGIKDEEVQSLRPWKAYYSVVGAYYRKRKATYPSIPPDAILTPMARFAEKKISYEMPTGEHFVTFMAAMSDEAQSQYIAWLLAHLDDVDAGLVTDDEANAWVHGEERPTRSLERMVAMPALYAVMQTGRNRWWAQTINRLLDTPGRYFVAIGQLHILPPMGILNQLQAIGVRTESIG